MRGAHIHRSSHKQGPRSSIGKLSWDPFYEHRMCAIRVWVINALAPGRFQGNFQKRVSSLFDSWGTCISCETALSWMSLGFTHDDAIKWKHFPCYWPVVGGTHRPQVNSPHKDQWRGDLVFYLICALINGWVNNREAGYLRRHRAHYDVTVMWW